MSGLFTLTSMISNKNIAFGIIAILQIVWVVGFKLGNMVHEPITMNKKEDKKMKKKSTCGLVYSNLK